MKACGRITAPHNTTCDCNGRLLINPDIYTKKINKIVILYLNLFICLYLIRIISVDSFQHLWYSYLVRSWYSFYFHHLWSRCISFIIKKISPKNDVKQICLNIENSAFISHEFHHSVSEGKLTILWIHHTQKYNIIKIIQIKNIRKHTCKYLTLFSHHHQWKKLF